MRQMEMAMASLEAAVGYDRQEPRSALSMQVRYANTCIAMAQTWAREEGGVILDANEARFAERVCPSRKGRETLAKGSRKTGAARVLRVGTRKRTHACESYPRSRCSPPRYSERRTHCPRRPHQSPTPRRSRSMLHRAASKGARPCAVALRRRRGGPREPVGKGGGGEGEGGGVGGFMSAMPGCGCGAPATGKTA